MLFNIISKKKWINNLDFNSNNFGSHDMQVVLLTYRIIKLQKHISIYRKDFHNKNGLLKLIFHRRRILKYIKSRNINRYFFLIKKLNLRD